MIRPETATLLEDLSKRDTPAAAWPVVERLVAGADPELIREVRRRAETSEFDTCARAVVTLLSQLRGADAEAALRTFLSSRDLDAVAAAMRALAPYLSPADGTMLASFLRHDDHAVRLAAIVASGYARDRSLAEAVAASLDASSEEERMQAAITLGHLSALDFAPAMAARLSKDKGRVFQALVAALEMLRARVVLPTLVSTLRTAANDQVWELAHALSVISGRDVAVEPRAAPEQLRRAWLDVAAKDMLATVPPASVANVRRDTNGLVRFDVLFGRGNVQIDFDPPAPGTTWPRWGRSLIIRGEPVLDLGSTCSTCESLLQFVSWPAEDVSALADVLEDRRGASSLDQWVESWEPLLCEMRGGRYLAAEFSFRVERIDSTRRRDSWFVRRHELRVDEEDDGNGSVALEEDDLPSPEMTHYQGERADDPPTYPVVLPLSDPEALDGNTVGEFCKRITAGERPPIVAYVWLDEREVQARWPERFLYLAVLNGHHRLEAYARKGLPARFIAVARVEDSWGPPEAPDRYLTEAFELLDAKGIREVPEVPDPQ